MRGVIEALRDMGIALLAVMLLPIVLLAFIAWRIWRGFWPC